MLPWLDVIESWGEFEPGFAAIIKHTKASFLVPDPEDATTPLSCVVPFSSMFTSKHMSKTSHELAEGKKCAANTKRTATFSGEDGLFTPIDVRGCTPRKHAMHGSTRVVPVSCVGAWLIRTAKLQGWVELAASIRADLENSQDWSSLSQEERNTKMDFACRAAFADDAPEFMCAVLPKNLSVLRRLPEPKYGQTRKQNSSLWAYIDASMCAPVWNLLSVSIGRDLHRVTKLACAVLALMESNTRLLQVLNPHPRIQCHMDPRTRT